MWSLARFDLGLSDREFWKITPRKLDALARRSLKRQQQADQRAGVLAALVANIVREKGRVLMPEDFFPSLSAGEAKVVAETPNQMKEFIQLFRASRKKG